MKTFLFNTCLKRYHVWYNILPPAKLRSKPKFPHHSTTSITVESLCLLCLLPSRTCAAQACSNNWGKRLSYLCLKDSSHGQKNHLLKSIVSNLHRKMEFRMIFLTQPSKLDSRMCSRNVFYFFQFIERYQCIAGVTGERTTMPGKASWAVPALSMPA